VSASDIGSDVVNYCVLWLGNDLGIGGIIHSNVLIFTWRNQGKWWKP